MAWYAVYETDTGKLVSLSTDRPPDLRAGLDAANLGATLPDQNLNVWNEPTRTFVARPARVTVDRVNDYINDAAVSAGWSRMTVAQRTSAQSRLAAMLGPYRLRGQNEPVNLE